MLAPELSGKRLELLKEVVPRITRVAFLWGSSSPGALVTKKETQAAAHALGLQFQSIEVRDSKGFDSAFEAATKERAQCPPYESGSYLGVQIPPGAPTDFECLRQF